MYSLSSTVRVNFNLIELLPQDHKVYESGKREFGTISLTTGKETLGLLMKLVHEPEGAALRLAGREKELVLALCARWSQLERNLRTPIQGLEGPIKTKAIEE